MSTSVDIKFKDFGYFDSDVTGFDDATGLPIFDRAQNSEFLANMLGALIGNGVYPNPSTNLQVIERDDAVFGVQVLPGKIWIDGRFAWPKEPILLEADPASTTADRIDIIVVERNNPDRKFTVKRITGAPAASPVPPSPERTTDVHQRVLCQYRVRKNATKINQSDILDTRMDNELCGYVTGVIEQIDGETLFAQIEAMIQGAETQYTEWFAQIASEWEEWWNGQQHPDGYLTRDNIEPTLFDPTLTVIDGINSINTKVDTNTPKIVCGTISTTSTLPNNVATWLPLDSTKYTDIPDQNLVRGSAIYVPAGYTKAAVIAGVGLQEATTGGAMVLAIHGGAGTEAILNRISSSLANNASSVQIVWEGSIAGIPWLGVRATQNTGSNKTFYLNSTYCYMIVRFYN